MDNPHHHHYNNHLFNNLIIHPLLNPGPSSEAIEVEENSRGGRGKPVREQGEADHRHVLGKSGIDLTFDNLTSSFKERAGRESK